MQIFRFVYSWKVPVSRLFLFEDASRRNQAGVVLRRLPPISGAPVRIQAAHALGARRGAVHAGTFVRERRIAFHCSRQEFPRIFVHELFHFIWARLGNPARRSYERLVKGEWPADARGELGWSAEWRKRALPAGDVQSRSRRWREYCCESFCDTAAWLYSGVGRHPEFTLAVGCRTRRRAWFAQKIESGRLSI
jgi:hypothetical protein